MSKDRHVVPRRPVRVTAERIHESSRPSLFTTAEIRTCLRLVHHIPPLMRNCADVAQIAIAHSDGLFGWWADRSVWERARNGVLDAQCKAMTELRGRLRTRPDAQVYELSLIVARQHRLCTACLDSNRRSMREGHGFCCCATTHEGPSSLDSRLGLVLDGNGYLMRSRNGNSR